MSIDIPNHIQIEITIFPPNQITNHIPNQIPIDIPNQIPNHIPHQIPNLNLVVEMGLHLKSRGGHLKTGLLPKSPGRGNLKMGLLPKSLRGESLKTGLSKSQGGEKTACKWDFTTSPMTRGGLFSLGLGSARAGHPCVKLLAGFTPVVTREKQV